MADRFCLYSSGDMAAICAAVNAPTDGGEAAPPAFAPPSFAPAPAAPPPAAPPPAAAPNAGQTYDINRHFAFVPQTFYTHSPNDFAWSFGVGLYAPYGAGLSWVSPMGPLRLAVANPINPQSGDRINRLQFQIGNTF